MQRTMAETRTITIERPTGDTLNVQVGADLVDKFVETATEKGGSWRGTVESCEQALEGAVSAALLNFLED